MLFYSRDLNAFSDDVVALLERMARNIAFALDNFEREAERQRVEDALRRSEEKFRNILDSLDDAYYEVDIRGSPVYPTGRPCACWATTTASAKTNAIARRPRWRPWCSRRSTRSTAAASRRVASCGSTSAIIAMGKTLSLTVVAEGVETIEQQTFLREQACDEMQGYYFSKPIVADEFAALLRDNLAS
jgi:hypothetical protein